MVKNLLTILLLFFSFHVVGQETNLKIGSLSNGTFTITESQKNLVKAFEWTFRDGTKVSEIGIEQFNQAYYLVAICSNQNKKRLAAVNLDLEGIDFILREDAFFKTCSAVACENCSFFVENNKIVACKCESTGTISNHCHYKLSNASSFYNNVIRAKKMFGE
jgi:hypothetical protein